MSLLGPDLANPLSGVPELCDVPEQVQFNWCTPRWWQMSPSVWENESGSDLCVSQSQRTWPALYSELSCSRRCRSSEAGSQDA